MVLISMIIYLNRVFEVVWNYGSEVGKMSDGGDFARMVKEPVKVEIMIK